MQKDIEQNESYDVSISDWISILHGDTQKSLTLLIFTATIFFGLMVGLPLTITGNSNSLEFAWLVTLIVLLLVYLVFRFLLKVLQKLNEPYRKLLDDILYGRVTDTTKIRDRYKEIKKKY